MTQDYAALLGTKGGPAIRPGSSMPTSNLLCIDGQQIVVDCGLGVTKGLVDQGMQLRDLSLIFISHMHSDHYLELGPLIHTAWTAGLKTPVVIYGPDGIAAYWQNFLLSMKADIDLRIADEGRPSLADLVTINVIDAGHVMDTGGITVTAIRDFARGADLLIHEAMLESALPALMARIGNGSDKLMAHWLRSHTFAHDAAKTATAAGVKRLALSHLIPQAIGTAR